MPSLQDDDDDDDGGGEDDGDDDVMMVMMMTMMMAMMMMMMMMMTGSGKSFTMTGNGSAPGIIPRAISGIFTIIEDTAACESDVYFYVRISYVELYNNNFRNLLEFAAKDLIAKDNSNLNNTSTTGGTCYYIFTHSLTHSLTQTH